MKIAREANVPAKPPDSEGSGGNRHKGEESRAEQRDPAVLSLPSRYHRSAPEANLNHHKRKLTLPLHYTLSSERA